VVVAALAGVLWAIRPASDLVDGVAGPTEVESTRLAEAEAALVPSTVPSTTTTTVPDVIVGPLEAKGKPVPVVFRIGTFDPVVFITIDDGGIQRPELVEYIRQTGIPVTMFLTERYTSGDGVAYFRELQDLGATVQAHSITHTSLRGKPLDFQTDEVCGPVDTYERNYGERPRYFRPPYGNYDTNTLLAARSCGLKAVLWWSATYDSGTLRLQEGPLRRGEIILMHFNDHLTQDLQLLMQEVEAAGLRPALLDDYLDAAPVLP
jgi:peptidoglycan/xylan/chitin deacetylase (PgdA/CDA1 family)